MTRGFTLIETMVAITVLAVALVGPFTAIQNALMSSYTARDQLVASALAQEGLEYVRSVRDNNYLNERSWMHLISTYGCYGSAPTSYCVIDPTLGDIHTASGAMTVCPSLAQCATLQRSESGLYNHTTGDETTFKRVVQLRRLSDTEVEVIVEVHWTTSRRDYSITVTDVLRDWL